MSAAQVLPIYVPFRGGGERTIALAGGTIDVDFDIVAPMKPMVDAQKIQVLGIASDVRSPEYPQIPTMAEGGVRFEMSSWHAVFAPKSLPPQIAQVIEASLTRICNSDSFKTRMHNLELGVRYMSAEDFKKYFDEQAVETEAVVKTLGLYVDQAGK